MNLVEHGASVDLENISQQTACDIIEQPRNTTLKKEVLILLCERPEEWQKSPLNSACDTLARHYFEVLGGIRVL